MQFYQHRRDPHHSDFKLHITIVIYIWLMEIVHTIASFQLLNERIISSGEEMTPCKIIAKVPLN